MPIVATVVCVCSERGHKTNGGKCHKFLLPCAASSPHETSFSGTHPVAAWLVVGLDLLRFDTIQGDLVRSLEELGLFFMQDLLFSFRCSLPLLLGVLYVGSLVRRQCIAVGICVCVYVCMFVSIYCMDTQAHTSTTQQQQKQTCNYHDHLLSQIVLVVGLSRNFYDRRAILFERPVAD